MGAFLKGAVRVVLFAVIMAAFVGSLAVGWATWKFRASLPQLEGRVAVAGLERPITIARDEYGVPHIFGAREADVFFGLGYAHAQDRMFQMELIRRAMEGRIAETVPGFLADRNTLVRVDARNRIKGYHRAAQALAENLDGPPAAAVEAYTAGINALITTPGYTPPPEYTLLGFKPEPWEPSDTAAVWVYMADQLVAGTGDEFQRLALKDILDPEKLSEFVGGYPPYGETSLALDDLLNTSPALAREGADAHAEEEGPLTGEEEPPLDDETGLEVGPTPGSNNWVVDGDHTRSGKPLLANDPHLDLGAPSIWYMAHLALPDGDVVGYTIPGAPFVVLGHNERIAWGFTNTGYDVQDYRLRAPGSYPTTAREEVIKTRGGRPVTITVRDAAEGPVLDPAYFNLEDFGDDEVVLETTADDADNNSAATAYAIMKARDWPAFVEAGRSYVAPMQNMIYADVDGNIGYMSPGRVPIRDANGDWTETIPFEDLPKVENPASGVIATANNKIVPDGYPYPLGGEFATYRVMRIHERLAETNLHDEQSFRALQLDVVSDLAKRVVPSLTRARPETDGGALLQAMLLDWDDALDASSPEALAFNAWFQALHMAIYGDDLGEAASRFRGQRRVFIDRVLSGEWSDWCDDVTTDIDESCGEISGKALDEAAARLFALYGDDPSLWNWGEAHQALFDHPLFTGAPVLDRWFTVRAPHGGDASTVNVGHYSYYGDGFETLHAASMRSIYDLSDLDASLFIHAPGQSGHPLSPHYRDLAPLWSNGDYIEIATGWDIGSPPPGTELLELSPKE